MFVLGPFKTKHSPCLFHVIFSPLLFFYLCCVRSFDVLCLNHLLPLAFRLSHTDTDIETAKRCRNSCCGWLIKTIIYYSLRCELVFIICSRWILYHILYKSMHKLALFLQYGKHKERCVTRCLYIYRFRKQYASFMSMPLWVCWLEAWLWCAVISRLLCSASGHRNSGTVRHRWNHSQREKAQ